VVQAAFNPSKYDNTLLSLLTPGSIFPILATKSAEDNANLAPIYQGDIFEIKAGATLTAALSKEPLVFLFKSSESKKSY